MELNLLRILTGRHAGARVDLAPGIVRLGPDAGSDIVVTDWTFAPLELQVDAGGVKAEWLPADGGARQSRRLVDRQAAEFDGSVICVGPTEGDWPADTALLAAVFDPAVQAPAARAAGVTTRRRPAVIAAAASCAVVGLLAALWWVYPREPAPTLEGTRALLQRTVDTVAPQRLQVLTEGSAIVVTGMVDGAEQANAVRTAIEGVRGSFAAMPRFSVATDVAEAIRGAVGLPKSSVKYLGDGVFRLTGEAGDAQAAKAAVERVAADLAPAVRRIETELEMVEQARPEVPVLSSLESGDVLVMQTRDGVKHVVVRPEEPVVTDRTVLSLPAPEPSMFPPDPKTSGAAAYPPKE